MGEAKYAPTWLIHFAGDDWWTPNTQSKHHIIREFRKKGYHILWVNPLGLRFPSVKTCGFTQKLINKCKSTLKGLKKTDEQFYVLSLTFMPVFKRGFFEKLNNCLLNCQLRIAMHRLGIKKAVCFVSIPSFGPLIHSMKTSGFLEKIVYYYSDQYDKYREISDAGPILEWDRILCNDSDTVYCASDSILCNVKKKRPSKIVKLLEHQVEFDRFDYHKIVPKLLGIPKPIIGYFGSLTDSNDWDIIQYIANRHPRWHFVFIGTKRIDLPRLENLPNVHFLGFIPYEDLPAVAANFSVGLMFWRMTDWIRASSPLKLKEYLALGLPVVSVRIEEVVNKYSRFVDIADDGPGFEIAIEKALRSSDSEDRNQFASQFSWSSLVDEIIRDCNI